MTGHKAREKAFASGRRRFLVALGVSAATLAIGDTRGANEAPVNSSYELRKRLLARRGIRLPDLPKDLPTEPYRDSHAVAGEFEVDDLTGLWVDSMRGGREVPWRAFLPRSDSRVPGLIYSHGGGGTRDSGSQFGRHLASHGLASIHIQHLGSDRAAFRENPRQIARAARDPEYGLIRFQDVGFAAQRLRQDKAEVGVRIDGDRFGVYGHSFGAITTLIAAGQIVAGFGQSLACPNFKAAAALSPSPPRPGYGSAQSAFGNMLMPIAHLTGSEDHAPNGDFDAGARLIPFEQIRNVDQYLLVLAGANHFTFSGDPDPALRDISFWYPGLERHHDLIRAMLTAFFRLKLAGIQEEQSFLSVQGLGSSLGSADRFEHKKAV